jgi:hypothetical protein
MMANRSSLGGIAATWLRGNTAGAGEVGGGGRCEAASGASGGGVAARWPSLGVRRTESGAGGVGGGGRREVRAVRGGGGRA